MQLILLHQILPQWLECAQPDMQGHLGDLHSVSSHSIQYFRREVQARGGRRGRARQAGKDGLVANPILRRIRSVDVRRQGDVPNTIEGPKEVFFATRVKAQSPFAEFTAPDHRGVQFVIKSKLLANADLPARADQGLPFDGTELPGQQHLHPASQKLLAGRIAAAHRLGSRPATSPEEPGWQHPSIVHNHQVPRSEQGGQLAK
jgi:hypothetical protein